MKRSIVFAAFALTVGLLGFAESNAQRPIRHTPAFTATTANVLARTTPKPPPPPRCKCQYCCF